jgi:large subunit ribosomal protein L21
MYAVIKTGGKQYKVIEGEKFAVEKLDGNVGDTVTLGDVLALGGDKPQIGAPLLAGATVKAEIIAQGKGDKVIVFKKKRRHNYRRKLGHRQMLTTLKVTEIKAA